MSRQDISMDAKYGEVKVTDNLTGKAIYPFTLLDSNGMPAPDGCCYGEVTVPSGIERLYRDEMGIHVHVPYQPIYKKLVIRLRKDSGTEKPEYVLNPSDNRVWFPVYIERADGVHTAVCLSELPEYNAEGNFNLLLRDSYLTLYSGAETDFQIRASKVQNEMFLLKATAGNLYQYPNTGVGLIDYLHSNLENNGLAAKLQSEFTNDKMIIKNAYMDSATGELLLEVEEKEDLNG
jgi:hypothetical protein